VEKAVCYLRVSSQEEDTEGVSLDAQEEHLASYCKLEGLEIIETITEQGISGAKPLAHRPGGKRLLQLLSQKKAEHVVALRLDRLFRDAEDALHHARAWDKAGIALHLVDVGGQSINTSTAAGKVFLSMMAGFAELEQNIAEKKTLPHGKASPFFEISTPRHMFEKAVREFEKMKLNLNTDTIFNFFVTAYHIMDYVKAQGTADQKAIKKMYNDPDFQMCGFICNKGKHLKLDKGEPYSTEHKRGALYGVSAYNECEYNEGPSYYLLAEGQRINVIELGRRLLQKWEDFLSDQSVQLP